MAASPINPQEPRLELVRGGPFYRAQQATHLITRDRWNLGRRIIFAIAIGWIPLLLITLFLNRSELLGLLRNYPVNSRMLIAVPVLLIGQTVMESCFRTIASQLRETNIVAPRDAGRFDAVIARLLRLRDSPVPELIIVLLAYGYVFLMFKAKLAGGPSWATYYLGAAPHLSATGWYYVLVSQLMYQFLIGLSLWKWLLWSMFLFRLSRMNLQLVPTHPDHHGGLGFLSLSLTGFIPLAFATSIAAGAHWREAILRHRAHVSDFKLEAAALLILVIAIAVGPLLFFLPRLGQLRRKGLLQYGRLGQLQSMEFESKWIKLCAGHEQEFLFAPEISTLTDFASSYENIKKMQPFPVEKGGLLMLALAVMIPLLPALLAEIPFAVVIKNLLQAIK
jgi:hypothetical protein